MLLKILILEYSSGPVIQYADKNLQKNKEFILKAIEKNTEVFEHLSSNFKKDPEIIKEMKVLIGGMNTCVFKLLKKIYNEKIIYYFNIVNTHH